ncbi:MAG: WYL domain-containing protein [Actinobacteria bacterium]|nr:WYL domain-containing protein [Actinomycetota bacterium]
MQRVLERLLNLLAFLLTVEHPVTAEEIRHTVAGYDQETDEAFRRTFERDKDLLRGLGIPLTMQATDAWEVEHGYVVPRDEYALEDPGLTDEERAALWLAAQAVRLGGTGPGPAAIFKLGGAPMTVGGEPLAADLGSDPDTLALLFRALTERRRVVFGYRGARRHVAPYGLAHRLGHWYLVGDQAGAGTRAYRVDRMSALDVGDEPDAYRRPRGFVVGDHLPEAPWEAGPDEVVAEVRFDPEVAWWAVRQLTARATVSDDADGGATATIPLRSVDAFIGWMLGLDDHAEILRPPELRARFVAHVRGAA